MVLNDYPKNTIHTYEPRLGKTKQNKKTKYINKREGINFVYRAIPNNKCRRNERNAVSP